VSHITEFTVSQSSQPNPAFSRSDSNKNRR